MSFKYRKVSVPTYLVLPLVFSIVFLIRGFLHIFLSNKWTASFFLEGGGVKIESLLVSNLDR